ncbi:MAG: hypothetical protein OEY69_03810, partial [Candidatus Krumholzibacteria bacterium]|nr:hypothetical protein [Candidatus Krumholzibacteria bacterium]
QTRAEYTIGDFAHTPTTHVEYAATNGGCTRELEGQLSEIAGLCHRFALLAGAGAGISSCTIIARISARRPSYNDQMP